MKRCFRTVFLTLLMLFLISFSLISQDQAAEITAVKKLIEEAYVKGVHIDRSAEAMKKGFHKDFTMLVLRDGQMQKRTLDGWTSSIERWKEREPERKAEITHSFTAVQVAGTAAAAQVEIFNDGKHIYSDIFSLYKFEDGWKIVNKIYYAY